MSGTNTRNILTEGDHVYIFVPSQNKFVSFDLGSIVSQGWGNVMLDTAANAKLFKLGGRSQLGTLTMEGFYVNNKNALTSVGLFQSLGSYHDLFVQTTAPTDLGLATWTLQWPNPLDGTGKSFMYGIPYAITIGQEFPQQPNVILDTANNALTSANQPGLPFVFLPASSTPFYYCNSGTTLCNPVIPRDVFNTLYLAQNFAVDKDTMLATGPVPPPTANQTTTPAPQYKQRYWSSPEDCTNLSICKGFTNVPSKDKDPGSNNNKQPFPTWVIPAATVGVVALVAAILLWNMSKRGAKQTQQRTEQASRF